MNFENLTTEGYVAFILAIIFSIVTIASAIYFAKHKKISLALNIFITLIFPILTVFCWTYLFMNLYAFDFATTMYVSLGAACGYGLLAFGIALLISWIIARKNSEMKKETSTVQEKEEKTEDTTTEEVSTLPLLITIEKKKTKQTEEQPEANDQTEIEETEETLEDVLRQLEELDKKENENK